MRIEEAGNLSVRLIRVSVHFLVKEVINPAVITKVKENISSQ